MYVVSTEETAVKSLEDPQRCVKTQSEVLFEQYLKSQNLKWNRIAESGQKQPDYKVAHGPMTCAFEVKEFADPEIKPTGGFSPCPPIREKILAASKKFKHYRDSCCALVLWNTSIFRSTIPEIVLSAAFGEKVCENRTPLGVEPSVYYFFGRSELRPNCNTRFSAIVILAPYQLNHVRLETWRRLNAKKQKGEQIEPSDQFNLLAQVESEGVTGSSYEGTIRTIVLENPYAKIPFPPDLFVGPFDQHWSMQLNCFQLSFMGSQLKRLKNDGVPFIYL
jgi:hypothetical protein